MSVRALKKLYGTESSVHDEESQRFSSESSEEEIPIQKANPFALLGGDEEDEEDDSDSPEIPAEEDIIQEPDRETGMHISYLVWLSFLN
jgi:hypothetical protein